MRLRNLSLTTQLFLVGLFILVALLVEASGLKVSTLTTTNRTRWTAEQVSRLTWVDARGVLPAGATVDVIRTASGVTDTVATVVCTTGRGASAPLTNTTHLLYGEYLQFSGATSGTLRVISGD